MHHNYAKIILSFSLLFLSITFLSDIADAGLIYGKIYSANSGEPIAYAVVEAEGTKYKTVSNESGEYRLKIEPDGKYTIKTDLIGYRARHNQVEIAGADEVPLNIYLTEAPLPMAEVKVTGSSEKPSRSDIGQTAQRVNVKKLSDQPGMVDDLLRQVQEMPQVKSRSDFSSKMYVRGNGPEHNIVYVDDVPAYNPYRALGVLSAFNPNLVKDIHLYPGGYPAEYGGRLSAVLDIQYRDGAKKKHRPFFDLNTLAANGIIEGPFGSTQNSYLLSVRRTFYDLFLKNEDTYSVYPHFYDIYGKLSIGMKNRDQFYVAGWHNGEGFRFNQKKSEEDDRSYNAIALNDGYSHGIYFNWKSLQNGGVILDQKIYHIHEKRSLNLEGDIDANYNSLIRESALKGDLTFLSDIGQFKAGYLGAYSTEQVNWDGYGFPDSLDEERPPDSPDVRPIQEHFHINESFFKWSSFISGEFYILDILSLYHGYRFSGGGLTGHFTVSPRWGIIFSPTEGINMDYFGGIYFQPPTYSAFLEKNYLPELERNPEISPERAIHNIFDLEYKTAANWQIHLSLYHKYLDRLIYNNPPDSLIPENLGEGRVKGLELSIISDDNYWLNGYAFYSLSQAKLKTPLGEYSPNYDQRHSFTMGLSAQISRNWEISSHYRYGSGYPYTEVAGRKPGANSEETPWIPVWGEINDARYPFYSRLDLRISYDFQWAQTDWNVYLEGINILARENVYSYVYDREYLKRSPISQLPFLPNFGLSIEF